MSIKIVSKHSLHIMEFLMLIFCIIRITEATANTNERTIRTVDYQHLATHMKRQYKSALNYLKLFNAQKTERHSSAVGLKEDLETIYSLFQDDCHKMLQTSRKLTNRLTPYFLQYSEQEAPIDSFVVQMSSEYTSVANETLPLNNTKYDKRHGYSQEENSFEAVSAGLYFFALRVSPVLNSGEMVTADLYKNSDIVGSVSSDFRPVTNMFLVDLQPEDRVYVKVPDGSGTFDDGARTQLMGFNI